MLALSRMLLRIHTGFSGIALFSRSRESGEKEKEKKDDRFPVLNELYERLLFLPLN